VSEEKDNERVSTPPDGASGEGQEEDIYFAYSATLRIFGAISDFDEITERLGVAPSATRRKGDHDWGPSLPPNKHDMWSYNAPVKNNEPLQIHIDTLWNTFRERKEFLLKLKPNLTVDVFLGYRSNCDHAGVEVPLSKFGNVQGIADTVRAFNHCALGIKRAPGQAWLTPRP